MNKILITGASGKMGRELIRNLDSLVSTDDEIVLLKRSRPIDINQIKGRNISFVDSVEDYRPYNTAFHFAGNIHTSRGHDPANYGEFKRDNVELTERVCNVSDRVFFASTDNVFSGMDNRDYFESDTQNATNNHYGKTKAIAEKIVLENQGCVIRFQSPLGVPSNLIADRVIDALEGRPAWPFWNDQFLRPALFDDIVLVFKRAYEKDKKGIYHTSCSGDPVSRAEIAKKILGVYREYNLMRTKDYIEEEPCDNPLFPKRLVLDTEYTRKELGIEHFTNVDDAIKIHVLRIKEPEKL